MTKKVIFDTLEYVKMLSSGGVSSPETHAYSLTEALNQNLYTKSEVDQMIDAALKQFEERTVQLRMEMAQIRHDMREDIRDSQQRYETMFHQYVYKTVAIIGSLIAIVGSITTLIITLIHIFIR